MALGMYKPEQGYWTRTCSAIAGLAITGAGTVWAVRQVERFNFEASTAKMLQYSIGGAIAVVGLLIIYTFIYQKQNSAEFLIATEGEMKKVNWSSRREVMGSTWVVIFVSLSIAIILWLVDLGFSMLFRQVGLLGPGM